MPEMNSPELPAGLPHELPQGMRRPTPAQVLESLRCHQRWSEGCGDIPDVPKPKFETPISEWLDVMDMRRAGLLHLAEETFQVSATADEWKPVLARRSTMRELCEFVSARGTVPSIAPVNICGQTCLAAGYFRAIAADLQSRGVPRREIEPALGVGPLLLDSKFIFTMCRVAPEHCPCIFEVPQHRSDTELAIGALIQWLTLSGLGLLGASMLMRAVGWDGSMCTIAGVPLLFGAMVIGACAGRNRPSLAMPHTRNLRDLCRHLAGARLAPVPV